MYIIRNALRCIGRAKARNLLIGVLVLVIAISACLGLSIRQAAENARAEALEGMSVTATISFDRSAMMQNMKPPSGEGGNGGGFSREDFADKMGKFSGLTLEEYQTYAKADSVADFYYTTTVSFNGNDDLNPVSNETETDTNQSSQGGGFGGFPGGGFPGGGRDRVMGAQSDFSVLGVSSEQAMTAFVDGTAKVTEGEIFAEGTDKKQCLISNELATYNELAVGDKFTLVNPNDEDETYTLTVVGLYTDDSANQQSFSMMGATATDPANRIYMSHVALQSILDASAKTSETATDDTTGRTFQTGLTGTLEGTYVFDTAEDYDAFEGQVRDLGLDENYTVSSPDLASFEASLTPLNTLSDLAKTFLWVILIIGAIILVVLNIFQVRERKYEIGVLTAMGMKKGKVALQFLTEIFVVTMAAVIIGAGVGAVCSVPVTNALLENQITASQNQENQTEQNFGRPGDGQAPPDGAPSGFGGFGGFGGEGNPFANMFGDNSDAEIVSSVDSAMNLTVLGQMMGIALILTLVGGAAAILFVMRYEPLKILANRD